jgi:phosphohistidine swiveling domain-containing protein
MSRPRTPLLRPSRYYEAHDGSPPFAHAAAAVAVVMLATAGGLAVFLDEFAAALVAEELSWLSPAAVVIVPLVWLVQGGVLHAASALADGEGAFADTLALAGWGMVPSLARLLGVGALVVYRLRTVALPETPEGRSTRSKRRSAAWRRSGCSRPSPSRSGPA